MKQGELFITAIPQIDPSTKSAILLNWLLASADKKVLLVSLEK